MNRAIAVFITAFSLSLVGCSLLRQEPKDFSSRQKVLASFYGGGDGFEGKRTANGEIFDPHKLTAAHKTLPFGTKVKLLNPKNGRIIVVTINDRGPFVGEREFDISKRAAYELGIVEDGVFELFAQRVL